MESDRRYFAMRRRASSRIRFPFPGELGSLPVPVDVPPGKTAVVIVAVRRDARGGDVTRARGIAFVPSGTPMSQ